VTKKKDSTEALVTLTQRWRRKANQLDAAGSHMAADGYEQCARELAAAIKKVKARGEKPS